MKISPSLKCYRRKAILFRSQGLTTKGEKFRRTPNFKTKAERLDARRRRGLEAWERLASLRRLKGLTTRGGHRIYRIRLDDALVILAQVRTVLKTIESEFEKLPEKSKSASLRLANELAAMMKTIEK